MHIPYKFEQIGLNMQKSDQGQGQMQDFWKGGLDYEREVQLADFNSFY